MRFAIRALAVVLSIAASLLIYSAFIRPWFVQWGATPQELAASDPTDRLAVRSGGDATRAVTIDAPPRSVWPWIAQIGQGRGGFYSYDILENVLGRCDIHSTDRLLPQFDRPKTGDPFSFCGSESPATKSRLYVEPGRAIAYAPGWAVVIAPAGTDKTRLIARSRGLRGPDIGAIGDYLVWDVTVDTMHYVMERKMLEGIKRRAEGARPFSPLEDDVQVLSWTIAFLVMVAGTIGVFAGRRMSPQLGLAWAGFAVWMVLMLVQPPIVVCIALVGVLLAASVFVVRIEQAPDPWRLR